MALATEMIVVVYGARLQRLFVHYSVNLESRNIAREKTERYIALLGDGGTSVLLQIWKSWTEESSRRR